MSKNIQISELVNYISVDGSGNVVFTTVPAASSNTDKFLVSDAGVLKFRTAAQLLSDIGAQASGSYQAALSGTGFVKISGSTISYDDSTYLTTSSAGTTYVPYTGATSSLDVGTNDLLGRYLNAEGSGGLGGVLNIKQDAVYLPKGNGYSSIASSFTDLDFFAYTGASTYKNFTLRFDGLTDNTRRRYTLPDTDGTLALTSNLGAYLPLTGGTLTGALSGTSASFTSGLINGTTNAFFDINRASTDNAGRVRFQTAATDEFEVGLKGGTPGFHITKGDVTELVTVLTSGNVGIGTASPTNSRLLVAGSHVNGNSILGVVPVGNQVATIGLYNSSNVRRGLLYSDTGFVRLEADSDQLQFLSAGNLGISIFTNGRVFVGSSPSDAGFQLDVNGSSRINGTLTSGSSTANGDFRIISNGSPFVIQGRGSFDRGFLALSWDIGPDTGTMFGSTLGFNVNANVGVTAGTRALTLATSGAATFSSSVQTGGDISLMNASGDINIRMKDSGGNADRVLLRQAGTNDIYVGDIDANGGRVVIRTNSVDSVTVLTNGNVGIGTFTPNRKLEVITGASTTNGIRLVHQAGNTSEGMDITYLNVGNTTTSFDSIYNSDGSVMQFRMKTAGTPVTAMTILGSGYIGIGTPNPLAPVHANGGPAMTGGWNRTAMLQATYPVLVYNSNGVKWAGLGYDFSAAFRIWVNASSENVTTGLNALSIENSGAATFSSTVTATNFITTSDRRLKSEIKEIKDAVSKLSKFKAYEYIKDDKQDAGFIAQEVQEVIPYSINTMDNGYLSMNDRPILALIHQAIIEINERLTKLENK